MTIFYYLAVFAPVLTGALWLALDGFRIHRTRKAAKAAQMLALRQKLRLAHPVPLRTIVRHNGAEVLQRGQGA